MKDGLIKILLLTDFSSGYSRDVLRGVVRYAQKKKGWAFYRLPLHFKMIYGSQEIVRWAKKWKVDAIIAERYNRMRATIVTSNLAAKDIKDRYQLRIYDRLRATNKIITFKGDSKRESWG